MKEEPTIKILLVDDNKNNLLSMEVALESGNYTFSKVTSGQEALRILLKEDDFSLILLDVKMPTMDGYDTAELIYQRDKLRRIPIIFITAHDYEESAIFKGYKAGAVDFIRKPVNPEMLRSKVSVFTELYRNNQLLQRQEEKLQLINEDLMLLNRGLEERVLERTIELEELNRELSALNISKDKLLTVISHDLRNPLTSLLASSDKLSHNVKDMPPAKVEMFAGIINRTSNKILDQLNELVDWAKQQRDKTQFNPQQLPLHRAIDESLDLLRENAQDKGIALENQVNEDLFINADSLMFRSVVQNLVANGIKFTPKENGKIIVSAKPVDQMVEIRIDDNGIGISQYTKEKLFENFNLVPILGTNKERGTGLGLLLVKDFVTAHGGTIRVKSVVNKGTSILFTMPQGKNQELIAII